MTRELPFSAFSARKVHIGRLTPAAPPSGFCPHPFEHTCEIHGAQTAGAAGATWRVSLERRVPGGAREPGGHCRGRHLGGTGALKTRSVIQTPVHAQVHAGRGHDPPAPGTGREKPAARAPRAPGVRGARGGLPRSRPRTLPGAWRGHGLRFFHGFVRLQWFGLHWQPPTIELSSDSRRGQPSVLLPRPRCPGHARTRLSPETA